MTQRERQILALIAANPMISQQELADTLNITRSSVAVHISNLLKKGYIAGKGYVLRTGSYAVVVGGVNVDIGGRSHRKLVAADSNPGKVSISLGGVGRNIAHNMTLLGVDVKMLTAMGEDVYGNRIAASCTELGIDASRALRVAECATSTYLYIADESGEMALALSDMEICDRITPTYLAGNQQMLSNARVIVADTNIPAETLVYLAENSTAPIFCDPVSTIKAEKLLPILDRIHTLKPNRLEAELLSGVKILEKQDAEKAANALLEKGVQRVFLSMGAEGVYDVGACSRRRNRGRPSWEMSVPRIATKAVSNTECPSVCFKPSISRAPKRWDMRMLKPWVKPWAMPSIIQLSQSTVPSAASASIPTPRPTMAVSTMV